MGKRGNNEGTAPIRRADGRYAAAVSLPDGKRKWVYGKTRAECAARLVEALSARQNGVPQPSGRATVGGFLDDWFAGIRSSLAPASAEKYETVIRRHLRPALGKLPLARLGPAHLQRFYADQVEAGLAGSTIRVQHAVLHRALDAAARWGLVARNVADLVDPPKVARRERRTLSAAEARRFLASVRGDRLEALYVLALTTGMREGELLALRWRAIDLERGTLQVQANLVRTRGGVRLGEPKTPRSRRQILLTPGAVDALRRHRVAQLAEQLQSGVREENGFVFATATGRPLRAAHLASRYFPRALARAGLPPIRFHDLRHTAATLLLEQGVHPKVVSEMLGHSQIAMTLDLYSHVTPGMQRAAVQAMAAALGGAGD